jgi:maleate cis-trans isomerase
VIAISMATMSTPSCRWAPTCRWSISPLPRGLLGKPVIAINTATYWHALRSFGIKDRISGLGRLLAEF